ncbi:MAG: hypothetical protein EXS32_15785 [Opitutus sp.]|nr:hypothetical protein [Opitutus sp.]
MSKPFASTFLARRPANPSCTGRSYRRGAGPFLQWLLRAAKRDSPAAPSSWPESSGQLRWLGVLALALRRVAVAAGLSACATILAPVSAAPAITEFMASNRSALADDDGDFPDWIEIYNPDATAANLAGWYLTDDAKEKTKWKLPAVTIAPRAYLIVFASDKNRDDPARPLHTNFTLDADGDYLALVRPDGVTVATEFTPNYPLQLSDISYGFTQPSDASAPEAGYFRVATPGAANGGHAALLLPQLITFSRESGTFTGTVTLALSGASTGQQIRYVLATPSAAGAAVPDPTAKSAKYSGPITIATTTVVRAAVFSSDDSLSGFATSAQFLKITDAGAQRVDTFSSALPVLVLDNLGGGELADDRIYRPGWLHVFLPGANGLTALSGTANLSLPVGTRVRGNSSADFPKKGYNLGLQDKFGRSDSLPLLGLDSSADWALISPWQYDRTSIHSAYVYALSNAIGRWAPRTRFAELFFNWGTNGLDAADYLGLTVLTDRLTLDSKRVDLASLDPGDTTAPAITGGYLLKIDDKPPTEYGFITEHGIPDRDSAYVVVDTPAADRLSQAQRDYIRGYVQQMENALFAGRDSGWRNRAYRDYLDFSSWVDHHLLETFSGNVDAFTHSDYFSKDRKGKIVAGPAWDFDRALGSYDPRTAPAETWSAGPVSVWGYGWFGVLASDPEFQQAWVDRWQALRRKEFSTATLLGLADSLAAQVTPAAAARDAVRWPDNVSPTGSGFAGEIARLKDWLTRRATWIDQQFVAAPAVSASGSALVFTAPTGAQLIYTLDGSDPRSLGGAVAPGAKLSTAPLTVSATANVHARSYRAELKNTFPGSPWSSAMGGASSSPLSPVAKIVNLSSRALVGGGEDALIAGVVVADSAAKNYLVRGVGPTLATFGVANTLPDPLLTIMGADGKELYRNTGWKAGADAAALPSVSRSVGAFPLADAGTDAALLPLVAAGNYTVRIASATNRTGVGLAELYEYGDNGRTLNLSARARVRGGEGALIGGFVIQGPAYKRVLIRAIGPTLAAFGVAGFLPDPILTIYSGQTAIALNDIWGTGGDPATVTAAAEVVGAFALATTSADSALLITLPPGAYTVEVSGKNSTEGVALLEIYEVP